MQIRKVKPRNVVTCPRSHSWLVTEFRLELKFLSRQSNVFPTTPFKNKLNSTFMVNQPPSLIIFQISLLLTHEKENSSLLFFSSSLNMLLLSVVKIQTHTWFINAHGAVFYILVSYLGHIIVNKYNNLELKCVKN